MDIQWYVRVAASTLLAGASVAPLAMSRQGSLLSVLLKSKEREKAPEKPTILIVEDNQGIREAWVKGLSQWGKIREASTRREALDEVKTSDILVLDLVLDGSNGDDVLYAWTKDNPDAPVCVVSGHIDLSKRDELLERGVCNVIEKPISLGALTGIVRRYSHNVQQQKDVERLKDRMATLERGYVFIFVLLFAFLVYNIVGPEGFKWLGGGCCSEYVRFSV